MSWDDDLKKWLQGHRYGKIKLSTARRFGAARAEKINDSEYVVKVYSNTVATLRRSLEDVSRWTAVVDGGGTHSQTMNRYISHIQHMLKHSLADEMLLVAPDFDLAPYTSGMRMYVQTMDPRAAYRKIVKEQPTLVEFVIGQYVPLSDAGFTLRQHDAIHLLGDMIDRPSDYANGRLVAIDRSLYLLESVSQPETVTHVDRSLLSYRKDGPAAVVTTRGDAVCVYAASVCEGGGVSRTQGKCSYTRGTLLQEKTNVRFIGS
ncbi:MAG: hypothetical protein E6R03_13515 [Hyphomicrobiaceae bacterium]|nr:MAG: hypothetical protein E6R03_13515 [Hyphomicrobiaceae bacterium]